MAAWHAEWAWLGEAGIAPDVLLEATAGVLSRVEVGVPAPAGAVRLPGVTLPGMVNAHSHAFHRALRGRTHHAPDFWAWRDRMFATAQQLDPDRYHALARACFAEMATCGITAVGEFHYLHHGPDGVPYNDPNVMAEALRAAATAAGIRLTLLDTIYLRAGFDRGLTAPVLHPVQRRFRDRDATAWAERVDALATRWEGDPMARPGAAIHSVRAVDSEAAKAAAAFADQRSLPLHVHASEQEAENDACVEAHGCSPLELLSSVGALGPRSTAVHATHVTTVDVSLLAASGTSVCLCPTTERDLADGIGPARELAARGVGLALGTDSHAVIDPFEEARAAELHERLNSGCRVGLRAEALLAAATVGGARSIGWPETGALAPGRLADFVTVGFDTPRLAGTQPADLAAALVFVATAADVTDVVVGGRPVVRNGEHCLVGDIQGDMAAAVAL